MADDLKNEGHRDSVRINVNEPFELQFWSKELDVTADELRAAVKVAGSMAADVHDHILRGRCSSLL